METITIYEVIWASSDDPFTPSTFCTLDIDDANKVYNDWQSDADEEIDFIYINVVHVPIPVSLQSKFAIGT
jgi:hypothetical protein